MSSNVIIKIENATKHYLKSKALNGVSVEMSEGEEYLIRGSSGSGKSTLLYLLGGLDRPTSGKIIVNQMDLQSLTDEELALYRNRYVGFVFQFHFLLSSMNCLDNILLPSRLGDVYSDEILKRAKELAKYLQVDHCLEKFPFELSGGEQQRISIIRALSLKPKLLLCDEPTGNLDSENSSVVIQLLRTLAKEFHSTLVIVTHDPLISSRFKNQLVMKDGVFVVQ